jgi:superfamily II RNA helicase
MRRREIDRRLELLRGDPKARNPNSEVSNKIVELEEEKRRLPHWYDIDPRFTFAPESGMITLDDICQTTGTRRFRSLEDVRSDPHRWHVHALLRGIGVHFTGISGYYRQAVEILFRKKQLSVVIATSTLAQARVRPACCRMACAGLVAPHFCEAPYV